MKGVASFHWLRLFVRVCVKGGGVGLRLPVRQLASLECDADSPASADLFATCFSALTRVPGRGPIGYYSPGRGARGKVQMTQIAWMMPGT